MFDSFSKKKKKKLNDWCILHFGCWLFGTKVNVMFGWCVKGILQKMREGKVRGEKMRIDGVFFLDHHFFPPFKLGRKEERK